MKKAILSILFFMSIICLSAQTNSTTGSEQAKPNDTKETKYFFTGKKISLSGFLAPSIEFSSIQKEAGISTGLNLAMLVNQSFFIGIYGTSLNTSHYRLDLSAVTGLDKPEIEFYHVGLYTGYLIASHKMLHLGIAAKVGYGQIYLKNDQKNNWEWNSDFVNTGIDNVLVFTPQLELELNLTKFMKLNIFGGYRMLSGVDKKYVYYNNQTQNYYKTSDYNSPYGGLSLCFGFFGTKGNQQKDKPK